MKKTKIALMILAVAALLATLAACNTTDPVEEASKPTAYVAIDVNPSVELIVDQHDTVMSASGVNEDAQAMLYDEGGIVGVQLDVAIKNLVALAKQYGYVKDDGKTISLSAYSAEDENFSAKVAELLKAECEGADVVEDLDLALKVELEDEGYDISIARYRLVSRAASVSGKDAEELLENDDKELLEIVKNADASQESKFGKIYGRAVAEARFALENAKISAKDGLYSIYLIQQTLDSDSFEEGLHNAYRAFFANVYAPLRLTEYSLQHYYDSLKEYISNPVFTKEDYAAAFEKVKDFFHDLTIDIFGEKVTDSEGNVTRESIKSYMNTLYRSLPEDRRGEFEEQYREVKHEVLDKVNFDNFDTQSISDSLAQSFDDLSAGMAELDDELGFGDSVKLVFEYVMKAIKATIKLWGLDKINFKELLSVQNLINNVKDAEQKAYDEMALDEQDLENIAALENTIRQDLDDAKAAFDEALAKAKQSASEFLQKAKDKLAEIKYEFENADI